MREEEARIQSTTLGVEDDEHVICSLSLTMKDYARDNFGGSVQNDYGIAFIRGVLNAVGVELWEDLKGRRCRVRRDCLKIHAIGHFSEDRWFNPETDMR